MVSESIELLAGIIDDSCKKGNTDFFVGEALPSYGFINMVILEEMKPYLDKAGIPYIECNVDTQKLPKVGRKTIAPKLILIDKKHVKKVSEIEKGMRIRMSCLIKNKEDMLLSLYSLNKAMGTSEGLCTISNLSEYVARRAADLSEHNAVATCINNTNECSVTAHENRKRELRRSVISAMLEELALSEFEKEKRCAYFRQAEILREKSELVAAKNEDAEMFYIVSLDNPDRYIEVSPDGYDKTGIYYYENNSLRMSQPITPADTFSDRLDLASLMIPHAIVLDKQEYVQYLSDPEMLKERFSITEECAKEQLKTAVLLSKAAREHHSMIQFTVTPELKELEGLIKELNEKFIDIELKNEPATIPFNLLIKEETGISIEELNRIAKGFYTEYVKDEESERKEEVIVSQKDTVLKNLVLEKEQMITTR